MDFVNVPDVVTDDSGQGSLSDFPQLVLAERAGLARQVVKVPVPFLQLGKLVSNQAHECEAHRRSGLRVCLPPEIIKLNIWPQFYNFNLSEKSAHFPL